MAPMIQMGAVVAFALFLSGAKIRARWFVLAAVLLSIAMSGRGVATEFRAAAWFSSVKISAGDRARLMFKLLQTKIETTGIVATLIHEPELIVLDESFGALDPQTLQQALRCVFDRAPTLLVIAHP